MTHLNFSSLVYNISGSAHGTQLHQTEFQEVSCLICTHSL